VLKVKIHALTDGRFAAGYAATAAAPAAGASVRKVRIDGIRTKASADAVVFG